MHFSHRVGRSTARQILNETCEAIIDALKDIVFPSFTKESVGATGSSSDSSVFRDCSFANMLAENRLDIPPPANINRSHYAFPFTLIADAAFPLRTNIMTPYSRRGELTSEESHYNKEISRGRIIVENGFGVLTARWRILGKSVKYKQNHLRRSFLHALLCITLLSLNE
uniref:DDE Tnp4 domain-containing protein n=1 Tax=Phlebotomus papatasi TaxID=29031 RepID=A0A1B0GNW3_PHLPP